MTSPEPMIVALDATPLTVPTGGVTRYTQQLAYALAREFPRDEYWLLSDQPFSLKDHLPGEDSSAEKPQNLKAGNGPRNVLERRWWWYGLNQEMDRRGVMLFHGTDFAVPYRQRRPSVMTVHDLSPWLKAHQLGSQKLAGHAAGDTGEWQAGASRVRRRTPTMLRRGLATMVITPSETVRRQTIQYFGLSEDHVVAVPLAAAPWFRPVPTVAARPTPNPYFLYVGTLEPRKNIQLLVDAWRVVRRTHAVDLVLAGRVRQDFRAPRAGDGLHVPGAVPDEELPGLYSGALAVVYPSLYEGFGLPVLEAMQCGAVVVTSHDPAIEEVTGQGAGKRAAVHVDAGRLDALIRVMEEIIQHPEHYAEMRRRAVDRAGEFSWQRTARLTHDVYGEARERYRAESRG